MARARMALAAIALGALMPVAALAQADPGAPEGARKTAERVDEFDRYALPVGRFALDAPAVREVEGKVARTAWRLDAPQASVAGVLQGYRERLAALGFEPLFSCMGEACGGFDFRFGAEILPPPDMLVDVRDFAQLSAARAEPAAFFSVLVSRVLDAVYVQTVAVEPPAAAAADGPPGEPPADGAGDGAADAQASGEPATPESASEEQVAEEPEPDEPAAPPPVAVGEPAPAAAPSGAAAPAPGVDDLRARLLQAGRVPVGGVDFGVGGAVLSPGSGPALDALARMLTRDEGLSVFVVGHSDNQGALDPNIELSRQRAATVRQALIERGVAADRLEARGVGFLSPVASNASEEGRAMNRRVELVLR